MLLEKEIIVGGLYAWDTSSTNPAIGCNLFTISEDTKSDCGRLIVTSIDGLRTQSCGEHCLISAETAIKRLEILRNIAIDEYDSHEQWCYDKEVKYLKAFEQAYSTYMEQNPVEERVKEIGKDMPYDECVQAEEHASID